MNTKEHISYWLESAEHDLVASENLFKTGNYDWCLFIASLVIEKTIKAFFARDNNNKIPPKIHNLVRLAEYTKLNLTNEQIEFLGYISDFNLETRYPEYKKEFYKQCTKEYAGKYFKKIKEFRKWLLSQII